MRYVFLWSVLVLAGCAHIPQALDLDPSVTVLAGVTGSGSAAVRVNVMDERARKTLGTVGAGNRGADIELREPLDITVRRSLIGALQKMQFKPVETVSSRELRVEIRSLEYAHIRGMFVGTSRADVALKAVCVRDERRPYEKVFTGEHLESVQMTQNESENTQIVNSALSKAMSAMVADSELMNCLAK